MITSLPSGAIVKSVYADAVPAAEDGALFIDTSTIYGSATALRSMATTVHDETASMSSTWSGLPEGMARVSGS